MPHGTEQNEGLLVTSKQRFYLNLKRPGDPNNYYERLGEGFMGVEPEMNEENSQDAYFTGGGFATSTITGGQATLTFSGHRYYGDPVQDWIFEHQMLLGNNRETDFFWVQPNGMIISGPVTLAVISGPGGEANQKNEIEVEIHFNGQPTVTHVLPPIGLEASNITANSVDLTWDEVDIDGATITYNVYQNGLQVANNLATPTYNATGLLADTEYNFYVIAVANFTDTGMTVNSGPSEIVSATTLAA